MHFRGSRVSIAVMILSLGLFACGGSSKGSNAPEATPKDGEIGPASNGGSTEADAPIGPIGFATASPGACMLHQEAGGHHSCLSGADGQCFHYGAVCEPADTCTLDLSSGTHRECKKFTEGACAEFGAACTPKRSCLYDMEQRRYRSCSAPKTGGCSEFGATCDPS